MAGYETHGVHVVDKVTLKILFESHFVCLFVFFFMTDNKNRNKHTGDIIINATATLA